MNNEREMIVIKHPDFAYELQINSSSTWDYYDAGNAISSFNVYLRHKKSLINFYEYNWRIVRASDKVIIAQKYIAQVQS